jgi:uncharacterized protein YjiS (DUF1127 family)
MSTTVIPFVRPDKPSRTIIRPRAGALLARLLSVLALWLARRHQREALADLAENGKLLADIGLTREQALHEAGKPFWR